MEFSWDSANINHIARHDITPNEAEQVIGNDPLDLGVQIRNGEDRFLNLGETDEGRILLVVTTRRGDALRVVTAHPADRKARRIYEEANNEQHPTDP